MSQQVSETKQISLEEATQIVKAVEDAFGAADIERIMVGFTPDAIAQFADFPEMKGSAAIEKFIRARFARQKNYRLRKSLRMVQGNMLGNYWEGEWEDIVSGKQMKGRGTEFWTMEGGKIALWEATFNAWEVGGGPLTPII